MTVEGRGPARAASAHLRQRRNRSGISVGRAYHFISLSARRSGPLRLGHPGRSRLQSPLSVKVYTDRNLNSESLGGHENTASCEMRSGIVFAAQAAKRVAQKGAQRAMSGHNETVPGVSNSHLSFPVHFGIYLLGMNATECSHGDWNRPRCGPCCWFLRPELLPERNFALAKCLQAQLDQEVNQQISRGVRTCTCRVC
jgi:hypothetical protein